MTADAVLTSDLAQQQARTTNQSAQLNSDFNEFLTLLTTQLQNQDPLNPTDTDKFTDQLVQFSQVEQQVNTNQKLDTLLENQFSNNAGFAVSYVGMDVTYESTEIGFNGTDPNEITFMLSEQAVEARINIRDENGDLIYTENVNKDPGTHVFEWSGKNDAGILQEAGTYTFSIDAVNVDGDPILNVPSVVSGRVNGVERQNGSTFLLVGERAVPLTGVIKAEMPSSANSTTTDATNDTEGTDETEATDETDETETASDDSSDDETTDES